MSSSTDAFAPRAALAASRGVAAPPSFRPSRIVRDAPVAAVAVLQDLDALSDAARRVVDPAAVAAALAEGYEEGRAEGYARGYDEGRMAALEEAAVQEAARTAATEQALGALRDAVAELATRRDETVAALEEQLVAGAFELAEALVGRELELATDPGRDALARALRLTEGPEAVVARLHPDDVDALGEHADLAPGREVTVVADATVERGGCVLQAGAGQIDARLRTALERVRRVLAP